MSHDIRVGITKTYRLGLKISPEKHFINKAKSINTDTNDYNLVNNNIIVKTFGSTVFGGTVSAQLTMKSSIVDKTVTDQSNLFYLVKTGSKYFYQKTKPMYYKNDNRYTSILDVPESLLIKSNRGLVHSKGNIADEAWMQYSFPYGGLTRGTVHLGYNSEGNYLPLEVGDSVKVDLMEGIVYIKQDYQDKIDYVIGYFDIEPLEIYSEDYLKVEDGPNESFCTPVQKSVYGDINIETLTETSYIITFSYNTFIVPSDPYFISVDGINLLTPRYIPKNTPILVEQLFNIEHDSFTEQSSQLFLGTEANEISTLTSTIKFDSKENYELFNSERTAAGLFLYREVEKGTFDHTKPAYLPLFSQQQIIKEY